MIWFGLEYSSLTSDWRFQMETIHSVSVSRDTGVASCDYMCPWRWLSSLICDIVSSLGHTIAREPLSHKETWNSPCGKDGWLTHIYRTMGKLSRKGPLSGYPSQNNGIKLTHRKLWTLVYMEPHVKHIQYAGCWDQWHTMMDAQGTSGHKWTLIFPQWTKCGLIKKLVNFIYRLSISKYIFQQSICGWAWDVN